MLANERLGPLGALQVRSVKSIRRNAQRAMERVDDIIGASCVDGNQEARLEALLRLEASPEVADAKTEQSKHDDSEGINRA